MNLSELMKKPVKEMTDEEMRQLELIGKREYDREYRERNREKRRESVRRSRIKKGLQTLKESNGVIVAKQEKKSIEKEERSNITLEGGYTWKRYRVKPSQASAFKKCVEQKKITQAEALEEAMKDWIAKNQ